MLFSSTPPPPPLSLFLRKREVGEGGTEGRDIDAFCEAMMKKTPRVDRPGGRSRRTETKRELNNNVAGEKKEGKRVFVWEIVKVYGTFFLHASELSAREMAFCIYVRGGLGGQSAVSGKSISRMFVARRHFAIVFRHA